MLDHHRILLPYKLTDPNKVLISKTFLIDKVSSSNLVQTIFQDSAKVSDHFVQIGL